jgi:sporulation integral membrane protein YlbJ
MKFLILSFKKNILPSIFVLIAIFLVFFSRSNLDATKRGLELWATTVVPALFPFFVVTNLLSQTKVVDIFGKLFDKLIKPLFNVPGIGGFAFVMGLISGYPVGAKVVSDFREQNLVTKDEGERLLAFTNNSGPLFILSSVGIGLFGDTKTGLLLLCTHILSCITVGIILGKFLKKTDDEFKNVMKSKYRSNLDINKNKKEISIKNLGEVLASSINSSISTILLIGGFVVIFSVIISILNITHVLDALSNLLKPILQLFNIDTDFAKPILSGILELTNGVKQVSGIHIKAISQNIILCAFLLGFGGFSVLLQVFSIVSKTDLSMKKYFIGKSMQGIFASFYTFLALKFIPSINLDIVETSNNITNSLTFQANPISSFFYNLGLTTIFIAILFIIFKLFNTLYKKLT